MIKGRLVRAAGWAAALAAALAADAVPAPDGADAGRASSVAALRAETTLRAAAALPPIAGLVERVGAGRWTCVAVVPEDADPHSWEPTPRQMTALSGIPVVFGSGMPFEDELITRLGRRSLKLPGGRSNLTSVRLGDEDHDHGHDHDSDHDHGHVHDHGADPHGWLSTKSLLAWSQRVSEELRAQDPDVAAFAGLYDEALAGFRAEVVALEREIRAAIPAGTAFGAVHPAFGPFAEAFGLRQIALEGEGREPGPRALAAAAAALRESGARVFLVQNDTEARVAAPFAEKAGARVVRVRLLGRDALGTIRRVAAAIAGVEPGAR